MSACVCQCTWLGEVRGGKKKNHTSAERGPSLITDPGLEQALPLGFLPVESWWNYLTPQVLAVYKWTSCPLEAYSEIKWHLNVECPVQGLSLH